MKLSKEVKIGVIVVAALAGLIWGFNFLKGINIFSNKRYFYAVYKNVDNLVPSNPVRLNGLKVGQVKELKLFPDTTGRILVKFLISNPDIIITKNTVAKIVSPDLLGSKAVDLKIGKGGIVLQSGDTLLSETEGDLKSTVDRTIAPLRIKAENLISSIDSMVTIVQTVLNKDARESLSGSFTSIKRAIESFEKTSLRFDTLIISEKYKISAIFTRIETITTAVANNSDKLSNIIKNLSNISDSVSRANIRLTITNAQNALEETAKVMEKINKGEGSLGMLVNDKKLYNRLDSASIALDMLVRDVNENPKKYVHFSIFGKKDKKKKK